MAETETRERATAHVEPPTRAPLVSQRQEVPRERAPLGSRPLTFREMSSLAEILYASGILPSAIKNKGQAFAIILAGQEMGVPAMRSLRSIAFAKGKLIVGADLQLGLFRRAGGRVRWVKYTDEVCELELISPNGDRATERFTDVDVARAGLDKRNSDGSESNHKKYPRFMKRSRCITGALKTIGFEDTAGAYDYDEAQHFDVTGGEQPVIVVEPPPSAPREPVATEPVVETPPPEAPASSDQPAESAPEPERQAEPGAPTNGNGHTFDPALFPFEPRKGVKLDAVEREAEGGAVLRDNNGLPVYSVSDRLLQRAAQWALKQRQEKPDDGRFTLLLEALEKEVERRIDEHDEIIAARVANETERPPETVTEATTEATEPTTDNATAE